MVTVKNTIDTGHEDMLHDAQLDYYGNRLATCSSDRSVRIFSIRNHSQELIADLRGHEGPVWQLAWSHPMYGSLLASCGYDRRVIIWKEQNGTWGKLFEYTNHDSSVNSVSWAPQVCGLYLACGSSDGSISILSYKDNAWDTKKIGNAHHVGCNAVSFGPPWYPYDTTVGGYDKGVQRKFVSGGCDNLVKIWRHDEDGEWKEETKLEGHTDWVRDVAWASKSNSKRTYIASCGQDGRVLIWNNFGREKEWTAQEINRFNDVVWHLSWSITGNILAVSGGDNKVSLWKETMRNQWTCISDVDRGEGEVTEHSDDVDSVVSNRYD